MESNNKQQEFKKPEHIHNKLMEMNEYEKNLINEGIELERRRQVDDKVALLDWIGASLVNGDLDVTAFGLVGKKPKIVAWTEDDSDETLTSTQLIEKWEQYKASLIPSRP